MLLTTGSPGVCGLSSIRSGRHMASIVRVSVRKGARYHISLSNLPLAEWHKGVTLCHRRGPMWRTGGYDDIPPGERLCRDCVTEMLKDG